ncbi:MAG: hypothetical protein SFU87_03370 [Chitinophagaceae bacterium]|nr:hypothetical protein [Chitinophagaceae bacterium]
MPVKRVAVECNPDELLQIKIGVPKKEIAHQANIGDLCNYLKHAGTKFGIIDEDPLSSRPTYLSEFTIAEEKHHIRKLKHPGSGKIIFVLRPRLEEWVYKQCALSGINPEDFFLPSDVKRFKDVINKRLNHFGKLIDELIIQKNPGIEYLKSELKI